MDVDIHVELYLYVMGRVILSAQTPQSNQPAGENIWMLRGVEATLNSSQASFKSQELILAILSPLYLLEDEEVKDSFFRGVIELWNGLGWKGP